MIGRLTGIFLEHGDDGSCILDVNGVGYELFVPLGSLGKLTASAGSQTPVTLHVHTHAREDALVLYGFATLADRTAFRTLLSVSGVGPRTALGILSVLDAEELGAAIARGDAGRMKGIPGVGKKTIERLFLELKDKFPSLIKMQANLGAAPQKSATPRASDAVGLVSSALVQMGYKPAEAERALSALGDRAKTQPIESLLREALAALS